MGILVPTYSILLEELQSEWTNFRRTLSKTDRYYFDKLFNLANSYVQAGNTQGNAFPSETFFLSLFLELLKQNHSLEKRIQKLEGELSKLSLSR